MRRLCLPLLAVALISALGISRSRAIELSLEENRAERGSVGFVDVQRLFKASPDAARAREGLEELVRQAEERVNAKKVELLRLRQDFGSLKIEREQLAASTPAVSVPIPAPAPVVKPLDPIRPSIKPVEAPKPAPVAAPPAPVTASPPAPDVAASTRPATEPLTINLPGLTHGPLNLERPGGSPLNPTRAAATFAPEPVAPEPLAPPVVSTPAAPVPVATEPEVVVSSAAPAPAPAAGPTLEQRLLELDERIVAKQSEVDRLQTELDHERLGAENALLDAESRKTDQVLARLYRAISEVARREGVSVVVDKSATLYGHPAVDLTDKILKQLQGAIPTQ